MSDETLRRPLREFAALMEQMLTRHDGHKQGWNEDDWPALVSRLVDETAELIQCLGAGGSESAIRHEAADVANFAMMIADNAANARKAVRRDR